MWVMITDKLIDFSETVQVFASNARQLERMHPGPIAVLTLTGAAAGETCPCVTGREKHRLPKLPAISVTCLNMTGAKCTRN